MGEDFTNLTASVATYGGFYVSRYELNADGGSKKGKTVANAGTYWNASTGSVGTAPTSTGAILTTRQALYVPTNKQ